MFQVARFCPAFDFDNLFNSNALLKKSLFLEVVVETVVAAVVAAAVAVVVVRGGGHRRANLTSSVCR